MVAWIPSRELYGSGRARMRPRRLGHLEHTARALESAVDAEVNAALYVSDAAPDWMMLPGR